MDEPIHYPRAADDDLYAGGLWPSAEYDRQLARLREGIGQPVYLVEVKVNDFQLTVTLGNRPATLLSVIDFPAADPVRRLYPHMIVLDDGRGLNLGWIARISTGQAFEPQPGQILYQETRLLQNLLFHERRLSAESIARTSKRNLAALLGQSAPKLAGET